VTLTVGGTSKDQYRDIQSAIDALPAQGGTILIAPGVYRQKVVVSTAGVRLQGSGGDPSDTVLVFGDSAATTGSTFKSYTVLVSGDDFHASNLTIQNDYWLNADHPPSQAVALNLTGDRAVLDRVRLLGHQDTLYANKGAGGRMARQYFSNCYIEGHVDFIFGNAKAFFHRCELHGLAHMK
jgi:pectin methylesterase-like acyl-CoA thioesterase